MMEYVEGEGFYFTARVYPKLCNHLWFQHNKNLKETLFPEFVAKLCGVRECGMA